MKNIKNSVLPILFVLLITSNLMAQNTITKPFTIKAGYQQTNLPGDDIEVLSVDGTTTALNSFLICIAIFRYKTI